MNERLSRRAALVLFSLVILCWGFNWSVAKLLVQSVPPLWMVAIRSAIALGVLLVLMLATRSLRLPERGDLPVVFNIALLHMGAGRHRQRRAHQQQRRPDGTRYHHNTMPRWIVQQAPSEPTT